MVYDQQYQCLSTKWCIVTSVRVNYVVELTFSVIGISNLNFVTKEAFDKNNKSMLDFDPNDMFLGYIFAGIQKSVFQIWSALTLY